MQQASDFQRKFGYNFVTEDQMMTASAAAYNLRADVRAEGEGLSITPMAISEDFPLYDAGAQASCGVRITFSRSLTESFTTDAPVWKAAEGGLALGLPGTVRVYPARTEQAAAHIEQINVPARIEADAAGANIAFAEGGMMQVVAAGAARTEDEGWRTETRDGRTVFTKYGAADTLRIVFEEEHA